MSKERINKGLSGFCNSGAHEGSSATKTCPHVFHFSMGVYEQWTCQCPCHPEGPANVERKGK